MIKKSGVEGNRGRCGRNAVEKLEIQNIFKPLVVTWKNLQKNMIYIFFISYSCGCCHAFKKMLLKSTYIYMANNF